MLCDNIWLAILYINMYLYMYMCSWAIWLIALINYLSIYIRCKKNGLGHPRVTFLGLEFSLFLIGSIFKQNNITTVENDATGQYDHNICSVTLKSWTHFYIFSISLVVYMVCVIF